MTDIRTQDPLEHQVQTRTAAQHTGGEHAGSLLAATAAETRTSTDPAHGPEHPERGQHAAESRPGRPRRRTFSRAVFGLAAGIAMVAQLTAGAPEAAAQGTRPCAELSYCFYENIDYLKHGGWQLQYKDTSFGDFNAPPSSSRTGIRDRVSSIINNSGRTICVYNNRTLRSPLVLKVAPYKDFNDLTAIGWNDSADYWRVVSAGESCPPK